MNFRLLNLKWGMVKIWAPVVRIALLSLFFYSAVFAGKDNDAPREIYGTTLGYKPDNTIEYHKPQPDAVLKMDIFYPSDHSAEDKRPCIVLFFGGGWKMGAPSQFYGYSKYFASRGMVAIAAEYRTDRSHKAIPKNCVEDGRQAVRYVRQHAAELGVDTNRIVVGGGSAGGHVAAAVAMCSKIDVDPTSQVSSMPNALVLFNPVYNNGPGGYGHDRVADYWQDLSPFHNICKGLPPTIVLFGSADHHVPVAQINTFQESMVKAGNDCITHIYEGEKHGFFHISKGGRKMFEEVLTKVDAFLVDHSFLQGENQVKAWTANAIKHFKESPEGKWFERSRNGKGK